MRIERVKNIKRQISRLGNEFMNKRNRKIFSMPKHFGRDILIGLIVTCFVLQPNLAVSASVNNSLKLNSGSAEKIETDTQKKYEQKDGDPIIKNSSKSKAANLFKAKNGFSKQDAIAFKSKFENDLKNVEEKKIKDLSANQETSAQPKVEEIKESNASSGVSLSSIIGSIFGWFQAESEQSTEPSLPSISATNIAIVRHGFNVNSSRIEGSVHQLLGEATTINGQGVITQDLLVPGVPNLVLSGNPNFAGIITGTGNEQPTNYQIKLNGNAQLRNLITRTNPAIMPTVTAPPASSGTQSVTVSNSSQVPSNFSDVRDLTLNGNVGTVNVPPGTYRNFIVSGGSGIRLGVAGATQPATYNLQSLTLSGNSQMQIAGPVNLNLASGLTLNASVGISGNENWLKIRISSGGLTLNGNSTLYGSVIAPLGTITINGNTKLIGNVACDRLTLNGNGLLRVLPLEIVPSVNVSITSPANNFSTPANSITVSGTAQSAIGIANVYVNNQPAAYNAGDGTWTISNIALPVVGNNTITARAVDTQGVEKTAQITVVRTQPPADTTKPLVSITTPTNPTTTQAETISISGTVSDPGEYPSGIASVTVNGTSATRDVAAGTWTLSNVGLNMNLNVITVVAADNAGNTAQATVNVTREPTVPPDTILPAISITSPENNAPVYTPEINVSGFARDEGENATGVKRVTVNGHAAIYNAGNQTWTAANVSLVDGENTIIAEVEDNAEPTPNIARAEIRVIKQNVLPPTIDISNPVNGTVVASNAATIAGHANSNAPNIPVTVTVNGENANLAGNEFTKIVNLHSGENTITAVAVNSLNQTSETSVTIISDTENPTIALQNVQPSVRPSLSYLIQSEAQDNHALASVEFVVNGERAALLTAAPYEFTLQIPGSATPGNVYNISAVAKDLAGNVTADSAQTIIAGPSGVSGYVFDDNTGYSVEGADATLLDPPVAVTSDENGEYSLVSSSSFGVVRIAKNGHTPVERAFTTASGTGLSLFDARLTGFDSQANNIGNDGGTAQGDGGRVQVAFTSDNFENPTDIRVSTLSQQGLINLLPYGWSPVPGAIVDVRAANSTAPVTQNLAVPAQMSIAQVSNLAETQLLTLVRYDETRHTWRVLQTGFTPGQNGALTASLPSLGQYAFLIADSGETTPPPPTIGSDLTSSLEVSPTTLNNAQVTASANPKSAVVSPTAKSTISVLANSQTKLPSGVSIEASFNETYRLLTERNPIIVDRLPQDFILYSYPSATTAQPKMLGASFIAKPTRADLTTAQLQFGNVHIGIHAGRTSVSGVLIGSQGGEVSSQDGATFKIEANSLSQNTSVFLESVNTNLSGITLPEGYEIIGALDLSLSGTSLTQSGKLSIPYVEGDNSRVILAKVITAGSVRGLKVVARAIEENNRIISQTSGTSVPEGLALPGIKTGGRYVFVRVPMPFGYAAGTVRNSANAPAGNARITNDLTPFIDLTSTDGKFVVLTKAESGQNGTNYLDAILLSNDATGNAQVVTETQDSLALAEINLASVALGIASVNPSDNAANVLVSSPVTVIFNKPVSPSTLTGSNFKVTTETGSPVIGNIALLSGNRVASFTPGSNLAFGTRYKVQITTGVKDTYGVALANDFVSTFTTSQIVTIENRLRPEKIRIAYPDEQGISTITIPAGSVPADSIITAINNNSGTTISTIAGTEEIVLRMVAQVGDEIILMIRQPDGTVYQISQAAYRRADGVITVGANGGTLTSDDGQILLSVPRGAIEGQANLKMVAAAESEITAPRTGEMSPQEMRYAAGVKIEVSGEFTQKEELHLELPAPANVSEGQRVLFMQPSKITENGVEHDSWKVITSGKVENGKVKTTSPPFFGVTLVGALISVSLLSFWVFVPARQKVVIGKITQAREGRTPIAAKKAIVLIPPVEGQNAQTVIHSETNERGEYALSYTNAAIPARVFVSYQGQGELVDTIPYQSTNPIWLVGIFGFETRYAAVEFPDPAGSPQNQPAVIQIEGRTTSLPGGQPIPPGQPDPLQTTGKVLKDSSIELKVKTAPPVQQLTAKVLINGAPQQLFAERQQDPTEWKIAIGASTEGAYKVQIETYSNLEVPSSKANAEFNFIAVQNPNNCGDGIGVSPTILNGWTPRNGAVQVDVGTSVHIDFNEKVVNLVGGETIYLTEVSTGATIGGRVTTGGLPVGNNTPACSIDFTPERTLTGGKEYKIKITTGVKDTENHPVENDFESNFTTFSAIILNEPDSIPTGAFKIALAGDFMATIEMGGGYPPSTRMKVFDISEPEAPELIHTEFTRQLAVSIDMEEYAEGQEISVTDNQGVQHIYKTIIALTTTSHPNLDRPTNVWFYGVLDDVAAGQLPVKLIGVVTLNYPNNSPEFPGNIKILGKRAYVGSTTSGGFWAIDMEGAIARLAEEGATAWYPAVNPAGFGRSGYSTDRVRQKAPSVGQGETLRVQAITAIDQAVDNINSPVVYPAPVINGSASKAVSFNVSPIRYDNRMAFFDADNNGLDDRILSVSNFNPLGFAIDVKAESQVSLNGQVRDLAVYLTSNRLWIFNVTNPRTPQQYNSVTFESLGLPSGATSLEMEGRYVYVMFPDRIAVIDIGSPDTPFVTSVITGIGSNLRRFAVRDGFIYALDGTGLRVALGRAFASVLVRGLTPQGEENCINPVLLAKGTKKMLQSAEILFRVYGHDVPQSAKVKIIKQKLVDGTLETTVLADLAADVTVTGNQNILSGRAVWTYNEPIDLDATYTAEAILDEGSSNQLISRPQAVPFSFLIGQYSQNFVIRGSKDISPVPDGQQPPLLGRMSFLLGAKARVTLKINGATIKPVERATRELKSNDDFSFGYSDFYISELSFPNNSLFRDGRYSFTLTADYSQNGTSETQTENGFVEISTSTSKIRQPGSIGVNNVELQSGNLALSYGDINIPGRGLSLDIVRSYNSHNANVFSPFGYGWQHNYQVLLSYDPETKFYTLQGGEGSGQEFDETKIIVNKMKAKAPYQGTLVKNPDGSLDYFTKSQTQYHFRSALSGSKSEAERVGYMGNLGYIKEPNGNKITLNYDSDGKLVKVTDASEVRALEFKYEQTSGAVISGFSGDSGAVACTKKNAWKLMQKKFLQAYTRPAWRITEIKGPGGLKLEYLYHNETGNLLQATRKGSEEEGSISDSTSDMVWNYAYDETDGVNTLALHLLKSVQSPNGHFTGYKFNLLNQRLPVKEINFPESINNKFEYIEEGETRKKTILTDGRGNTTEYIFDAVADDEEAPTTTTVKAPLGAETSIVWNKYGQKLSETDALGLKTSYTYDDAHNPTVVEVTNGDAVVYKTTTHFDSKFNKPDEVTTMRGNGDDLVTKYTIDAGNGNIKQITLPNEGVVKFAYNSKGDLTSKTDQFGTITALSGYDNFGNAQTVQILGSDGNVVQTTQNSYDLRSRLLSSSGNLEPTVTNTYDALDRVIKQETEDPTEIRAKLTVLTNYKPEGQVNTVERLGQSGLRYKATNFYDGLNRVTSVLEEVSNAAAYTQTYKYDGNSNVQEVKNRRGVTTKRSFNELNFVVNESVVDAGGTKSLMNVTDIDKVGNVKQYTDLYGKTITQSYDNAYRVTERSFSDCKAGGASCSETFVYDGSDNIVSQTDKNNNLTTLQYDKLNRVQKIVNPLNYEVNYIYTDAEHKMEVVDATKGITETSFLDALNRPLKNSVKFGSTEYVTEFSYDGLKTTVKDPRGVVTEQQLSALSDVGESKTLSSGTFGQDYKTSMKYSAFGAVTEMVDALERKTTYTVDGFNRVKSAEYPLEGITEEWEYDGEGSIISHTDKRGVESTMTYDILGRQATVKVDNNGPVTVLEVNYDDAQASETRIDANDHSRTFIYDGLHRIKEFKNAENKTKTFVYDGNNVLSETDFKGIPTTFEYDKLDRLKKVYDRNGKLTSMSYADGNISTKTVTDRRSNQTIEKYDALGRLIEVTQGGELVGRYEYDANNNQTASEDGESNRSEATYNNLNRMVVTKRGGMGGGGFIQTESYSYDAAGNLKVYSDGRGGSVSNKYNELNHLTERLDGENNRTTYVYDGEGLLKEMTEPCGNSGANCDGGSYKTSYAYNAFGSITNVTDAGLKSWSYTYYDDGKLLKEANDALSRQVKYEYDNLDRVRFVRQPLGLTTSYNYDENDNITSIQDANGQTETIVRDTLDRPDFQTYTDSSGVQRLKYDYSYDDENNVYRIDETLNIGAAAANFTHNRVYDSRNRLKESVDKFGHRVDFSYDKANNITSITDYKTGTPSGGTTTNYVYDRQNRLQTVTLPGAETVNYNWHADGLLQRVDYASGMKREYSYDNADRITSIKNTVNAGEIQQFNYVYDANSNRKSEEKRLQGQLKKSGSYKYDTLNRLTEAKETTVAPDTQPQPNQTLTLNEGSSIRNYEYDAVGNREREHSQSESVTITRTADAQGQVTQTRDAPQLTTRQTAIASFDQINRLKRLTHADNSVTDLEYDNNGNLIQVKQDGEVQQALEYDPRNQLRKVLNGQSQEIAAYDYDFEKRRVEKTVSGFLPERYVYAGENIVAEYRGATNFEQNFAKYQNGAGEVVRADFAAEGSKYYFNDILGSTTALAGHVNGNWTATNSYDYDSWGKISGSVGASANTVGYTGQRLDGETGLMALGNGERYYSPTLARFIQQDSLTGDIQNPHSLNRFAYTYNNPYSYTDRSGNEPDAVQQGIRDVKKHLADNSTGNWYLDFYLNFQARMLQSAYSAVKGIYNLGKELISMAADGVTYVGASFMGIELKDMQFSSKFANGIKQAKMSGKSTWDIVSDKDFVFNVATLGIYGTIQQCTTNILDYSEGRISEDEYFEQQGELLGETAIDLVTGGAGKSAKIAKVTSESTTALTKTTKALKNTTKSTLNTTRQGAKNMAKESVDKFKGKVKNSADEAAKPFEKYSFGELRQKMKSQKEAGYSSMETKQRIRDGLVCFVAGTLIHTKDGEKKIEDIREGDQVLSYDEQTQQFEYRTVVQTFEKYSEEILSVQVEGEANPLGVTPEHPFFVKVHHARNLLLNGDEDGEGEWKAANELQIGDEVLQSDRTWARIIAVERRESGAAVYNFEVFDNHNYFVGEQGTLVHNDCNNTKGAAFENLAVSKMSRNGEQAIFRPIRRGGIDIVSIRNGDVILNEAKFANKLQYDDFTAITRNLSSNAQEVLDNLKGNTTLTRQEKTMVRQTLGNFLSGNTPANLRIRVITGKSPVGRRLQNRLNRESPIPIDFETFR